MVLSGCSPTLVAALCALLTALAIMYYARVRQEILDAQVDDSSSQLDMVIRAIQFDVSSFQANAHSGFISSVSGTTARVERVDELTIKYKQSLVAGESPVHLKGNLLDGWELVNRSIWRLAMEKEWPVLTDVLSLQTVPASESFPAFLAHVSHEKGAMISQRVNAGQERTLKRASIVRQMYFADFLNDMRANHFEYPLKNHSATNTYHFYSTDFKVLESLAKVQHLTRWRALQLDDFNSSYAVSQQSQQQQQQQEQEQQEQQETMKAERERDAERDTESLGVENGSGERSSVLNTVAPVFSMLHPCSALQARYSEYHTMRAQVQGLTDYYLFAPEQAWTLNLFPSIHPSAYQSQLDFQDMRCDTLDETEQNRDENGQNKNNLGVTEIAEESQQREICSSRFITGVGGIEGGKVVKATLSAGEVLYIPPYWTVHTEARQLSVTIDVLTPSDTQRAFLRAVYISSQLLVSPSVLASRLQERKSKTELPKSREKKEGKESGTAESKDTKEEIRMRNEEELVLAQVFLSHVLSRIRGISSLNKYARKLYRSRWSALFPEESLFVQRSQFNCLRGRPDRHAEILRSINKEEVERAAKRVAVLANSDSDSDANLLPHPRPHFRGARSIWLAGFVENVARWAMKDADGAVFFIRECLALDGKIEVVEEMEGPSVLKVYPEEYFST